MRSLVDELEIEKGHADHMAAMAQHWMKRAQDAERTLAVVVYAAERPIAVHSGHLSDLPRIELLREECAHDMTTRFRARLRALPAQGIVTEGEDAQRLRERSE